MAAVAFRARTLDFPPLRQPIAPPSNSISSPLIPSRVFIPAAAL
jgi:hypothetical protein